MDFFKAEIASKKKQMEENIMDPEKQDFKRKDLAAKLEEQYWKRHN